MSFRPLRRRRCCTLHLSPSALQLIPKLICRICCKSNKDLFCPATTKQDWLYGPYCWMYKHI